MKFLERYVTRALKTTYPRKRLKNFKMFIFHEGTENLLKSVPKQTKKLNGQWSIKVTKMLIKGDLILLLAYGR